VTIAADRKEHQQPISWVKPELDKTIQEIKNCLEAYGHSLTNFEPLLPILEQLKLARGAFHMLELYGASLLIEDMERTVRSLLARLTNKPEDAYESLVQACIALEGYLDRLSRTPNDSPQALLPIINDLRAARNEPLLTESSLFLPNLSIVPRVPDDVLMDEAKQESLAHTAKSLRPYFHAALLTWFRNSKDTLSLQQIKLVIRNLESTAMTPRLRQLWWIAGGLVEALVDKGLRTNVSIRLLLGQYDRFIKLVANGEFEYIEKNPPTELLKNILFYIAHASSRGERVSTLKKAYSLSQITLDESDLKNLRDNIRAPRTETFAAIARELNKNLSNIKTVVDSYVRGQNKSILSGAENSVELNSIVQPLRHIADTLSLMSLGKERQTLATHISVFESKLKQNGVTRDDIMSLASTILHIESVINNIGNERRVRNQPGKFNERRRQRSHAEENMDTASNQPINRLPGTEYRLFIQKAAHQARENLGQVKKDITAFLASNSRHALVQNIPQLLNEVHGCLVIISQPFAARLTQALISFAQKNLLDETATPDEITLDRFAEAIVGLEYFLEGVTEGRSQLHTILAITRENLAAIGYAVQEPKQSERKHPSLESVVTNITKAKASRSGDNKSQVYIPVDVDQTDDEVAEIFAEEAEEETQKLARYLETLKGDINNRDALNYIRHIYHTLKGSGRIAGATDISEFAAAIEEYINRVSTGAIQLEQRGLKLLVDAYEILHLLLSNFQRKAPPPLKANTIIQEAISLSEEINQAARHVSQPVDALTQANMGITEEARASQITVQGATGVVLDLIDQLDSCIRYYHESRDSDPNARPLSKVIADLQRITISEDEPSEFAETTGLLLRYMKNLVEGNGLITLDTLDILEEYSATTRELFTRPLLDKEPQQAEKAAATPSSEKQVESDATEQATITTEAEIETSPEAIEEIPEEVKEPQAAETVQEEVVAPKTAEPATTMVEFDDAPSTAEKYAFDSEEDSTLIDIFIEEAQQLVHESNNLLAKWVHDIPDEANIDALKRLLHTLKGGARMAGITAIGNIAHATESLLERLAGNLHVITPELLGMMHNVFDSVTEIVEALQHGSDFSIPFELMDQINHFTTPVADNTQDSQIEDAAIAEIAELVENEAHSESIDAEDELFQDTVTTDISSDVSSETSIDDSDEAAREFAAIVEDSGSEEDIVAELEKALNTEDSPPVLTEIVEEAPVSVAPVSKAPVVEKPIVAIRKPVEAKPGSKAEPMRIAAETVDSLVEKTKAESTLINDTARHISDMLNYLSEMDAAISRLQSQLRDIEFGHGGASNSNDELDMAEFSESQQAAQRLMENVGDIENLHNAMTRVAIESDTLIQQQSRLHSELSDELIHSRMTVFADQTHRMNMIVRQACRETGKQAVLHLHGLEGAVDRAMMDHLISPFEHLLRNAIAHGIEAPEQRAQKGKPEIGKIDFTFDRDGNDLVFNISDDGAGINIRRIFEKAVARELIRENDKLSDDELTQFIFEPGFSTTNDISQLAGRGIGMDVVNSEIQRLGGEILVHTEADKGTTFTVRVPFTSTLNKTLLCRCGETLYAVSQNLVEGTRPIDLESLVRTYCQPKPVLNVEGQEYPIWYLGTLLNDSPPVLPESNKVASVILLRSNRIRLALQVDEILDIKDAMINPTGPQLGKINGISGASILNDGEVALILDVPALVRMAIMKVAKPIADDSIEEKTNQRPHIMVVDDSITVRKVTERFLKRNSFEPVLAKDGVEALEILEHTRPNLFLLDIEMPRMDGLELAREIRKHPAHADTPIIMITSRTSKAHKQAADEAGVDIFLGKPYQENQLLSYIHRLLEDETGNA